MFTPYKSTYEKSYGTNPFLVAFFKNIISTDFITKKPFADSI